MKFILICSLILCCCCDSKNSEPYYQDVCVHESMSFIPTVTMIGKTTTTRLQPVYHCDQYEHRCIVPVGSKTEFCPPEER